MTRDVSRPRCNVDAAFRVNCAPLVGDDFSMIQEHEGFAWVVQQGLENWKFVLCSNYNNYRDDGITLIWKYNFSLPLEAFRSLTWYFRQIILKNFRLLSSFLVRVIISQTAKRLDRLRKLLTILKMKNHLSKYRDWKMNVLSDCSVLQ